MTEPPIEDVEHREGGDDAPYLLISDELVADVDIPTDFDDGRNPAFRNSYDPDEEG